MMAPRERRFFLGKKYRREFIINILNYIRTTGSSYHTASLPVDAFPKIFPNLKNCPIARKRHRKKPSRWWDRKKEFIDNLMACENGQICIASSDVIVANSNDSLKSYETKKSEESFLG